MHVRVCRLLLWIMTGTLFIKTTTADSDCDFTFSSSQAKEGKFHSPNYPADYPSSKRCVFKFVGLSNERVRIRFTDFDIQGIYPDCRYDYIDIYVQLESASDPLLGAPMLGRFCGDDMDEDLPKLIISTHRVVVVVFYSDGEKSKPGFQANYAFIDASIYNVGASSSTCTFSMNSLHRKSGYIVSPTYPGTYPDNYHCNYDFIGLPGERIKLTFLDFSIFHGGDYCPFDFVKIKDGRYNDRAEDIGVFCGKYENVTIFSSGPFMFVEFVTRSGRVSFDSMALDNIADYKFDRRGFNISYEFNHYITFDISDSRITPGAEYVNGTECDIRISSKGGSNGTFKSPGYPSTFPRNTVCRVFLDGMMNNDRLEKVVVTFSDFNISGVIQNCTRGYLSVTRQGHRRSTQVDEKFCGQLWPPRLESLDARMILTFDTRGATPGQQARFMAEYRFMSDYAIPGTQIDDGQCSFLFESTETKKSGFFNSPRHPNNYPPFTECIYMFRPENPDEKLLISFDIFSLNPKSKELGDERCDTTDFLELSEKIDDRYVPVDRFCGNYTPAPILAHTGVKMRFKSMRGSSFQGFKARYEFIPKDELQKGCQITLRSDGRGGVIKSPKFPLKYGRSTYCEWKILASKTQNRILIQLETFKIEGSMGDGCKNAVLRVENEEICGDFNKTQIKQTAILSTKDKGTIQFLTSSRALGAKGFQLTYTEVHLSDVSGHLPPMPRDACYGFKCKATGYCISSDLQCDEMPNCGINDDSDEKYACYGFKCKATGYCISSDLQCDEMPNCGINDDSDEKCDDLALESHGPQAEKAQIVHIVIGSSISVFFCVVLLICGVYHRKKFRTRDRECTDSDHVEVRYVAATSGSNTTDRLLTLDKSETSRSPERTDPDQEQISNEEQTATPSVPNDNDKQFAERNSVNSNHNSVNKEQVRDAHAPHEGHVTYDPPPPPPPPPVNSRPVPAPKVQKVSIV